MGLEDIVHRLGARGVSIAQTYPELAKGAGAELERDQELIRAYNLYERPGVSGVSLSDLRGLASTQHSPTANLQQVRPQQACRLVKHDNTATARERSSAVHSIQRIRSNLNLQ